MNHDYIEGWIQKRSKCFFTYIHLDLFRSQLSICKSVFSITGSTVSSVHSAESSPIPTLCQHWYKQAKCSWTNRGSRAWQGLPAAVSWWWYTSSSYLPVQVRCLIMYTSWYWSLKWYYVQFSLQKLGCNCYRFQIAI